jgi:uncharacterized protein (DUF952 family)
MHNEVYKVLTLKEWDRAKVSGLIITKLDQEDGFTHLSTASQLNVTLFLYFANEERVMLLQLDQSSVCNNLQYECSAFPASRKGLFPHFYGTLKTTDVSQTWELQRHAFQIPDDVLLQGEAHSV